MAKLPALQFYPGDWRKDIGVQSLTFHDRGVWFEILMLMHESERRGVLVLNGHPMPIESLGRLLGLDNQTLNQTITNLLTYGVASSEPNGGALMCRRMVRDEEIRKVRTEVGKLGGNPALLNQTFNQTTTTTVKQRPTPSSSSSSSITSSTAEPKTTTRVVVPDEHEMPAWLPQEPWDSFVRMRRKSKEPFTQDAVKLAIAKLGKMADAGQNVAEVLNQSTLNGWKGLFEIKGSASNGKFVNKSQQRSNSNIEAAANYIAEIDGREAAADFVRGATGQSQRYSLEDLRKPAIEAPDRGRAGSGHQPVTLEAPGGGNSIPRPSHA